MYRKIRHPQRRSALKALKMARADAGLTISELARRAGVTRDTISNAENGRHGLQAATLNKLARALGRTPSELLAEEERLAPKVTRRSSEQPDFDGLLEDERRRADLEKLVEDLPGWAWARDAVEDGEFIRSFEAAKSSPARAENLAARHREATALVAARLRSLKERGAQPAEVEAAKRDLIQARARETACTLLDTELLRGREVADVRAVDVVAEVAAAQRGGFLAILLGDAAEAVSEAG